MAGERSILWTSAASAATTLGAVAIAAVVIWNVTAKDRTQFISQVAALNTQVAALNEKVDKTNVVVADIKKIATLEDTARQLDRLNGEIKATNERLGAMQKASSLDGVKASLAQLDAKIDKAGTTLAELNKPAPIDEIKTGLNGIKTAVASLTAKVEAKMENSDKMLADVKTASQRESGAPSAGDAARDQAIARLGTAVGDLKTSMTDTVSAQQKSLDAIAESVDALNANVVAAQKAEKDTQTRKAAELPAPETTGSIPVTQLQTIHFDRTGRADLDAQTVAVIGNLKTLMNNRHNCAITVAGHTDTLGRDDVNLDVSKERADMVAAKLKTAFAGQNLQIDSVGWGERQLKVWTPDNKAELANRRVEVSLACKG